MTALLEVRRLTSGYGGVPVVHDLDLVVNEGEVIALLGANGAGKSTTLLTISGIVPAMAGTIHLRGSNITRTAPQRIASAGLVLVPEGRALVQSLTVAENFRLVRHVQTDPYDLFPELVPLRGRQAGLLSGGEQQMLAVARALSMGPDVLLVDELSLGLSPIVVARLLSALRDLASTTGLGVLLVEQHVLQALEAADRAYVLSQGRITVEDTADALLADRRIVESSYLGEAAGTATTSMVSIPMGGREAP